MTDILGTPTELSVLVGRTLGDGDFGGFRVYADLTITLAPDANLKDSFDSVQAWLEANVGKAVKAQKRAYDLKQQLEPAPEPDWDPPEPYGIADERAVPSPSSPVKATQATSAQSTDNQVWTSPTLSVMFKGDGEPYLLIKGGNFTKFGAIAWKESLPFDISNWADRDENNVQLVYDLPDGLQDAIVQMKVKDGKTVPDKVIGFQ